MSNIFTSFINGLKNFLVSVWHFLGEYMQVALPEAKAIILKDLLEIADPIVADLNNQNLSGAQKRDQAFSLISTEAIKIGKDVGSSLIFLAVEMAVQKIKNAQVTPPGNGGVLQGGVDTTTPPPAPAV